MTTQEEKIREAVQDAHNHGCILCDNPSSIAGLFVEHHPPVHVPPNGTRKGRAVVYALCERCFDLPNKEEQVEAHLTSILG